MKIGDKVKISIRSQFSKPDHMFAGCTGVIVGFDDNSDFPWDVYVLPDEQDQEPVGKVPFHKDELEVVNG